MNLSIRAAWTMLVAGTLLASPFARAYQTGTTDNNARCLSNARQIALATIMYAQDFDEKLPAMKSAAQTQNLIYPYLKTRTVFTCPATTKGYVFNPKLSGISLAKIDYPPKTPLFCDTKAHADGMWTVAYADGHCKQEKSQPAVFTSSSGGKKPKPVHK